MVDETRQQNQSTSKRTWESIAQENRQKEYTQSLANTNRLPTSSNKLADVIKPPTTALTPYLPSTSYSTGYNVIPTKSLPSSSGSSSGRGGSGSSQPVTTRTTPTPSASTLTGTTKQREQQIETFRGSQTPITGKTIKQQLSKDKVSGFLEPLSSTSTPTGFIKDVGRSKYDIFGFRLSSPLTGSGFGMFRPIGKSAFEVREEKRKKVAGKKEYESVSSYLEQPPEQGYSKLSSDIIRDVSSKRSSEYEKLYEKSKQKAEQELALAKLRIGGGADYSETVKNYQKNIGKLNIGLQGFDVPKGVSRDVLGQPVSKLPKVFQSITTFGITSVPNISQKTITQKEIEKQLMPEFKLLEKGYKEIGIESGGIYSSKQIIEGSKEIAKDYGKYLIPQLGPALFLAESSVEIQRGILQGKPSKITLGIGGVALGMGGVSRGVKAFKQEAQMFQVEKNIAKELETLGSKNFELGKLGEIKITGERDLSMIKGFRESKVFQQNIDIIGSTQKFDKGFFFSTGKGSSRIAGTIEADINKEILWGPKVKPFKGQFYAEETFRVGSKGLPIIQSEFNTLTLSKGVLERETISSSLTAFDKNFKSSYLNQMSNVIKSSDINKNLFLSATRKVKDDLFVSNIGKIKKLEYFPESEFKIKGEYSKFEKQKYEDDFSKINVFHGTSEANARKILNEGLKSAKELKIDTGLGKGSPFVSTAISRKTAEGFIPRTRTKGVVLEIEVPKEKFFNAVRTKGLGAVGEVKFDYLPKESIRNPFKTEYRYPFEISRKVGPSVNIDINMKDFLITRTIPKSSISKVESFEISSKGSNLGLKQLKQLKQSISLSSIQAMQVKESFSPKQLLKPLKSTQSGFKGMTGFTSGQLSVSGLTRQRYSSIFSTPSGLKSMGAFDTSRPSGRFFSSSLEGIKPMTSLSSSSLLKQSSLLNQGSINIQELGFKELSKQSFEPFNFIPFGTGSGFGGGGGGFGLVLPPFSLGGNYLVSKQKKKSKRKKQKIRPSFTAQVFDIRGSLPKQGKYGVNPFDIRKIPKGKGYGF